MFDGIKRVCRNVKNVDHHKILEDIFSVPALQMDMVDMNREQMYDFGIDSQGKTLGEYAPVTITHWKPLAQKDGRDGRSDHVTLKDTGDFYDSIRIKNQREEIRITGDMEKPNRDLQVIYPWALGLTRENLSKVAGWILPDFRTKVYQKIMR